MTENRQLTPTVNPVIKFSVTDAGIAELAEKFAKPKVPQNKDEYEVLKVGIKEVAKVRIAIEKECTVQKAAALKHQRDVNCEGNRIINELRAIEGPMKLCKAEVDEAEERALAEKEEKERVRLSTIEDRLEAIEQYGQVSLNDSLGAVKKRLARVEELDPNDRFDEFAKKAAEARQVSLNNLEAAVKQLEERERAEKEQEERQDELDKQADELAERERKANEKQAELDKEESDRKEAEQAEEKLRLQKLEDDAAKLKAEEEVKAEEERQKALAPDKEKLRVFAQTLRELPTPVMTSDEGMMAIDRVIEQLGVLVSDIESEADRL